LWIYHPFSSFNKVAVLLAKPGEDFVLALFIDHGIDVNAIEENEFSRGWKKITASLPKLKAILYFFSFNTENNEIKKIFF
jgi:hypothetical protein